MRLLWFEKLHHNLHLIHNTSIVTQKYEQPLYNTKYKKLGDINRDTYLTVWKNQEAISKETTGKLNGDPSPTHIPFSWKI